MAIIIKKITRKTWLSVAYYSGLAITLFSRIFFGGSHFNLVQLEEKAKNSFNNSFVGENVSIHPAHADVPSNPPITGDDGGGDSDDDDDDDDGSGDDGE